jgi:Rrf2 family protein
MKISLATEYGFRGIVYLAMVDRERPVTIDEICEVQSVPKNYLIKIFKNLSQANLIRSHKGYRGGFSLARPAEEVTAREVFEALAGQFALQDHDSCLVSPGPCKSPQCCGGIVARAREALNEVFAGYTLRDLADIRGGVQQPVTLVRSA